MPRRCIVAGCDSVGGKDCSLHEFPKNEAIRKKWIKAVKEQRSNWDGPSPYSLLCSLHFTDDCFIPKGVRFRDELGMPTAKRLKPDAVPTIFARSINYMSAASSTSTAKPPCRPLSEKREEQRQQKSVTHVRIAACFMLDSYIRICIASLLAKSCIYNFIYA